MQSEKKQVEYCNVLRKNTKEIYNNVSKIYCPILKAYVVFNAQGFHHLLYKPDGTARDICETIYKLNLFPLAIPVIKNSIGISEERSVEIKESRKKNAKMKKGRTFALVAIVGKKHPVAVRVIILKVGDGNYKFLSIMKD